MPWLMKMLDRHTLGESPETSIKSMAGIAEQRLRLDNQAALR